MPAHDPRTLRRARLLARIVGALCGVFGGTLYGLYIAASQGFTTNRAWFIGAVLAAMAVGGIAMAVAAPLLSVEPYLLLEDALQRAPNAQLIGAVAGLLVGLTVAALLTVFLAALPWGVGYVIAGGIGIALVHIGIRTGSSRGESMTQLVGGGRGARTSAPAPAGAATPVVLDTSVLVDARVADVAATGFIQGRLVVATFVLEELQRLADAGDPARRAKGRRGLDAVDRLQREGHVPVEVEHTTYPGVTEVDAQLVMLARELDAALMTNDYNLNRLARIEGVRVLNLNDLANAVKPVVSSGESMRVSILKEGREPQQGVAYLEDGTMVVVEGGKAHLDESVSVTVTSVLQTPQGRIIFATIPGATETPRMRPVRTPKVANR